MSDTIKEFNDYRTKMNDKILADNNKIIKRIFNLDTKPESSSLLPCTEKDYLDACDQNIPERWFKAYKKGFN